MSNSGKSLLEIYLGKMLWLLQELMEYQRYAPARDQIMGSFRLLAEMLVQALESFSAEDRLTAITQVNVMDAFTEKHFPAGREREAIESELFIIRRRLR